MIKGLRGHPAIGLGFKAKAGICRNFGICRGVLPRCGTE